VIMSSSVLHSIQIHGSSSAEKQCIGAVSSRNPKKNEPSDRSHLPGCDHNHKWLCAPKGAGFLYARKEVQRLLEPLVVSWGWSRGDEAAGLLDLGENTSQFIDEQEWQGTRDPAAYLSVPAAIAFQAEHNWPQVRQGCHELVRYARQAVSELTGLEPICPDSPEWYMQMATIPLPPCGAEELKRRLYDEHRVEAPILTWGGRQFVRVSVQGYNSAEDVNVLLSALSTLLALRPIP
jgi:isopenicillin-N epimerase